MSFRWLKPYLPRGLYGRTVLSLLLPVVTLLLVVSVVFIQRHFEGVSEQMVEVMARDIRLVRSAQMPGVAETLDITVTPVPASAVPDRDIRRWYDFSGIVVAREMRRYFPDLVGIALPDDRHARLYFPDGDGFVELVFWRRYVSAQRPYLLFVNLMVAGGLMTLISFAYLRAQLRPFSELSKAAEAFGRGQHVPYRPKGATEVRAAGRAFVEMRARIERQIEQRTLMLSGVSHDLRTPLTRLRLGLALLDEDATAPLVRDVDDMQGMIDGFLEFARGTQEGEAAPVDPLALVRRIVEDMKRARVPVTLIESDGAGEITLREGAIRRAVENLITNAVRYGHRAEVSVTLTERSLRIRVEDDGPGIPPARREEAVRPFARLDPARNQDQGTGVGLGLSIVLDVARAHGGNLRLLDSARLGGLCAEIVIGR